MDYAVSSILLDSRNPRFNGTSGQREAVNALLADDPEKMVALAGDIVAQGALNPAEIPIFVEEEGRLVVIEGNRRVACLKLLRNPALADDTTTAAAFRALAERGKGPDRVTGWLAEDRDQADHWIQLRHTGENGGVGVKPWDPEQSTRYSRNKNSATAKAIVFADGVERAFSGDGELLVALAEAKKRLTNLGRVVGDPDLRRAFGFDIRGSKLFFLSDRRAMRRSLLRLLVDLGKFNVQKFFHKLDRAAYTAEAAGDRPGPESHLHTPVLAEDLPLDPSPADGDEGSPDDPEPVPPPEGCPGGGDTPPTDPVPPAGPKPKPTREEQVIYEQVRLRHVGVRTKQTLKETQRQKINDAPHLAAVMLRVVLELVISEAGSRYGWFEESEKLVEKVRKTILKLDPKVASKAGDGELFRAFIACDKSRGSYTLTDLNGGVHWVEKLASPHDVRAHSALFGPVIAAVDRYLGQNPAT